MTISQEEEMSIPLERQLAAAKEENTDLNRLLTRAFQQIDHRQEVIDSMLDNDDACNVISEILDQCELRGQLPSIEAIRAAISGADFARCLTLLSPIA